MLTTWTYHTFTLVHHTRHMPFSNHFGSLSFAKVPKNMYKSVNRNLISSTLPADAAFNNNYYDCATHYIIYWNGMERNGIERCSRRASVEFELWSRCVIDKTRKVPTKRNQIKWKEDSGPEKSLTRWCGVSLSHITPILLDALESEKYCGIALLH